MLLLGEIVGLESRARGFRTRGLQEPEQAPLYALACEWGRGRVTPAFSELSRISCFISRKTPGGAGREGEVAICLRDDPLCQGGLCCSLPPHRVPPPPPSWDKDIDFPLTSVAEEAGYAYERRQLLAGTFVSDFPGCGVFRTLAGRGGAG